jgi:S-adenosylmethionine uptake transporter
MTHLSINPLSHLIVYALAVVGMAVMDALAKGVSSLPIAQILVVRGVIAIVAIVLLARGVGASSPLRQTGHLRWQVVRGLLMTGSVGLFFLSLLAAGHLVLGEPISRVQIAACMAGFTGVLLIVRPGASLDPTGALLVLASTVFYTAMVLLTRRIGHNASASATALIGNAVITVVCLVLVLSQGWEPVDAVHWGLLVAVGLTAASANVLHAQALRRVSVSAAATLDYTVLVWAILLGWIFWGEVLTAWAMTGAAVITVAGIVALHKRGPATGL